MTFLEDIYPYSFEGITDEVYKYRFISEGGKEITKAISLRPMKGQNRVYNLGFGNLETNGETTEVNDKSTDNNTDASKVLKYSFLLVCATFLKQEADAKVVFFW
jgi:hypothetical protein